MKKTEPRNEVVLQTVAALEKAARKQKAGLWKDIAERLSKSRRKRIAVNLWKIEKMGAKQKKKFLLVPGKVLGFGEISMALNVIALQFSGTAKKKIEEKGKALTLTEALEAKIKPEEIAVIC